MSVQEYQKKQKVFQKKFLYRKKFMNAVEQPDIQYINIYHSAETRLGCFQDICDEEEATIFEMDKEDDT